MRELRLLLVIMLLVPLSNMEGQQETQSRMAKLGAFTVGCLVGFAGCRYVARRSPQMGKFLLKAIQEGNSSLVKVLVLLGVKINGDDINTTLDGDGRMPLHYAACHGYKTVVRNIIAAQADVNATDTIYSAGPLHYAALFGHALVVRYLIAAEADVDAADNTGMTPLHYAATDGYVTIVRALIAAEADVNAADNTGGTPLHYAATDGHNTVVEDLIAAKADVNAADNTGRTPLYYAVRNLTTPPFVPGEKVIQMLLEFGATGVDRGSLSKDQKSRLDRAINRIQEQRSQIEQAVYQLQKDLPSHLAQEISDFALSKQIRVL
jgi:ankyrin repeat protein